MNENTKRRDVGDLLLERGVLTHNQLELAKRRQARLNIPQHRAIVDLNYASEEETYRALAELTGREFIPAEELKPDKSVLKEIPLKLVLHYRFVPVAQQAGQVTLAFGNLPNVNDQGNLRLMLGKRIKLAITTPSGIHAFIKKNYGLGADTVQQLREGQGFRNITQEKVFDIKLPEETSAVEASISNFVDQVLLEALRLDATDVHLEPYANTIRLRYRIDGVLQDVPVPSDLRQLYESIVSRIKIMAGLNIAERRIPHDGRIAMKTGDEEYSLRVSIIPTKFGEAVCLRILGRQSLFLDMGQIGMEPDQQAILESLTKLPQGMVLITGPTGSGKTTTLYAALANANDAGRKIITIENPIEYQLDGVSQIQTNEEIGLTFSSGLRSVLRHDPDVILIGEIRDLETAEIAIRAAQTGHLVFSTLHANDSVSAVARLIEMKIEPFLIGSSLVCSIAQRLARRICRNCMTEDTEFPLELREEMAETLSIPLEEARAWTGTGCLECNNNGFRGRTALFEFFLMNDYIADTLAPGIKTVQLRNIASRFGWHSLRVEGWKKVHNGLISVAEHERITHKISAMYLDSAQQRYSHSDSASSDFAEIPNTVNAQE
ncbi:MAG: Flp pilus assembly complex ATPase component TadA [Verrucomicrobia bacterium]|nr:Flp pilus assembly complex ATPase component TadA [Verrucomicrobiota bacterium]MCF7708860.1 Flp pilus assembly complex ATPase component TadA [Verrucomicrobiota bacterium]